MMQSCCHCGKACFSRADDFRPHSLYLKLAGLILSDTTVESQYASKRDPRPIVSGDRVIGVLPGQRERSRPKHDVTEECIMSADDMRPEATVLIGLSTYAWQCQTHILYELMRQNLRWHSIGWSPIKSMMQAT
jgi:hypothetical protein